MPQTKEGSKASTVAACHLALPSPQSGPCREPTARQAFITTKLRQL